MEEENIVNSWAKTRGVFVIIVIIIISLVTGAVGGVGGLLYISQSKDLAKFLNLKGLENTGLDQKVIIQEDNSVIQVVKKAGPAVVSIVVSRDLNKYPGFSTNPYSDPFWPFFGWGQTRPRNNEPNIQQVGAGTGFFVTQDGLVLTNRHVVEDEDSSYTVVTNDGKTYEAKVVARDNFNDLAILKVEITNAPTLDLANTDNLQVGQRVVAIGNSLGQYQNTVTSGIVSGIGRSITAGGSGGSESLEGVIQTDAAINPGNSGGPLLNSNGQVIGINTAIDREGQLVGFAIPASDASRALMSFKQTGRITRAYLGVRYVLINKTLAEQENLPRDYGALVSRGANAGESAVIAGSPADKAGIVENDIILKVDGVMVTDTNTLAGILRKKNVGDVVELTILHKNTEKKIKVTLEENKP